MKPLLETFLELIALNLLTTRILVYSSFKTKKNLTKGLWKNRKKKELTH